MGMFFELPIHGQVMGSLQVPMGGYGPAEVCPAQKLDPPFDLPVRKSAIIPRTIFPSTPGQQDTGKCEFIKHGSPYDQHD